MQASVVRPFNVYGPAQDERFLIPEIVRQALDPDTDRDHRARPAAEARLHLRRDLVSLLIKTRRCRRRRRLQCRQRPVAACGVVIDTVGELAGSEAAPTRQGSRAPKRCSMLSPMLRGPAGPVVGAAASTPARRSGPHRCVDAGGTGSRAMKTIDIVLPVYNEEEGLRAFHTRLMHVLDSLSSVTNSGLTTCSIAPRRSIERPATAGRGIALRDGAAPVAPVRASNVAHRGHGPAPGDAVIMMDCDLQHPPEVIPELLSRFEEGFDVVTRYASTISVSGSSSALPRVCSTNYRTGCRRLKSRKGRRTSAWSPLSGRPLPRVDPRAEPVPARAISVGWIPPCRGIVCQPAASRRDDQVPAIPPIRVRDHGHSFVFKSAATHRDAHGLRHGHAERGVWRLAGDEVLRWRYFPPGFASLILVLLATSGLQLMFLGIVGEYLGSVFDEVKRRPLYVIDEIIEGGSR